MKKLLLICVIAALLCFAAVFLYVDNSQTQKYYRSADPMVEAYLEHQDVFQSVVDTWSGYASLGRIRAASAPMDYIRNQYACAVSMEFLTILSDTQLDSDARQAVFNAASAIMDITDVESISMSTSEEQGITVNFTFYYDYGVYAEFFYFEKEQNVFPYEPAHPKDIQKIDSHWFACLSTDTFMAE